MCGRSEAQGVELPSRDLRAGTRRGSFRKLMCGICGVFNYGTGRPADPILLHAMTETMVHRGPDDQGQLVDGALGLGMRRLSIIDLEGGRQPIANEVGSIHTVVNGEIYNFRELRVELEGRGHVFRTRSDSEVVVHAYEEWGLEALTRLNGMFGLAVWDASRRRLVIARDPFGIKPIYYRDTGHELSFGSEIRAIFADPEVERAIDPTGLEMFLMLRFVPSPWTAFRGIRKLEPGHALVIERGERRLVRFSNPAFRDYSRTSPEELAEELSIKICAAIDRQRVADVPVGVLLSGGVDSTAITSIVRYVTGQPPKTFTVGFDDFDRDERAAAQETAKRLGTEHHEVVVTAQEYVGLLDACIGQLEEPIATSSTLPLLQVCRLAREHVKVVVTGQGADEPFGGYARHLGERWGRLFRGIPLPVRDRILGPIVAAIPRGERLKRAFTSLGDGDVARRLRSVYSIFDDRDREVLLGGCAHAGEAVDEVIAGWRRGIEHRSPLSQMLCVDARFSLPDNLLTYTDKMSMAASLEARVPFLDLELMAYAESIPSRWKVRGRTGKWILKRALARWLPDKISERKKIAFETPVSDWLRTGELRATRERVLDQGSACSRLLNLKAVAGLFDQHDSGRRDLHWQLYSLITLELWHDSFTRRSAPPSATSATTRIVL
jgi:asparagine synthase (glutamine-hydrolysing)